MSLKSKILEYLQDEYPRWVNGGEVGDMARLWGYKPDTASRKCRYLENEGKINKGETLNRQVVYQAAKPAEQDSELDARLKEILKTIPVTWENQSEIARISKAIKSRNEYAKNGIIREYQHKDGP